MCIGRIKRVLPFFIHTIQAHAPKHFCHEQLFADIYFISLGWIISFKLCTLMYLIMILNYQSR